MNALVHSRSSMYAFVLENHGGPRSATLREVPKPVPGPQEIRVKVHAAGLNPVDYKVRNGDTQKIWRHALPIAMGSECAGIVDACGTEVSGIAVGDQVYARVDKLRMGALAEFTCIEHTLAATMPSSLDFVEAAGVPLAALTALQGLRDRLQVQPDQRIFISGGAGGVGTFAIQLAKSMGAHVITTASPRGTELVRRMGADEVIDYTQEEFDAHANSVDSAFDLVGGETLERMFALVKPGGMVLSIAGIPEPSARRDLGGGFVLAVAFWFASFKLRRIARRNRVRYRYFFMRESGRDLAKLAKLIDANKLAVVVDRVFGFEEIPEAFAYLEEGHAKGKVVVEMFEG